MNASTILVMSAMATCLGQIIGRAVDGVGATTGALLGALTGVSAAVVSAVRPPDAAGLTWRRIEFFAFPAVAVLVVTLANGSVGVGPLVVALVVVITIRSLIDSTAGDLAQMERMLDDRPTGAPPDRLRVRMLGVGLFLAAVAGYTAGVEAGFTDLSRPAVGGQLIAVLVWFLLGVTSVGVISRRARERAWRVNDVDVGEGVSERWAAGIAGFAAVLVVVAVVTPIATNQLAALPAQAIADTDGLNRFVTRALELFSRDIDAEQRDRPRGDDENIEGVLDSLESQAGEPPGWIGDVLLAAVIATIFVWAIRAGRNARFARGARPTNTGSWRLGTALLTALVRELTALVRALVRLLAGLRWRRRRALQPVAAVQPSHREASAVRWLPDGATETRIARSFASIADLVSPQRGETPTEVARTVGERSDPAGADTVLGGYLRARYSPEEMQAGTADRVEAAARRVVDAALDPADGSD